MSGIRPPDCSKLAKNPKNDNDVTIFRHDVNVKFFWRCFVSLVKFSYWSKFHVNIITGSGVMTISFYKGLNRNPEIGNIPIWVLLNIWRLEWVRFTKFGTNIFNKMFNKRTLIFFNKRPAYIAYSLPPLLFQILSNPLSTLSCHLQPPPQLFFLFFCFFG